MQTAASSISSCRVWGFFTLLPETITVELKVKVKLWLLACLEKPLNHQKIEAARGSQPTMTQTMNFYTVTDLLAPEV